MKLQRRHKRTRELVLRASREASRRRCSFFVSFFPFVPTAYAPAPTAQALNSARAMSAPTQLGTWVLPPTRRSACRPATPAERARAAALQARMAGAARLRARATPAARSRTRTSGHLGAGRPVPVPQQLAGKAGSAPWPWFRHIRSSGTGHLWRPGRPGRCEWSHDVHCQPAGFRVGAGPPGSDVASTPQGASKSQDAVRPARAPQRAQRAAHLGSPSRP